MFKNLFLGNTKVDFYKKSKFFYKVFIIEITIFIGIIIMVFTNTLDLNLSVDFTGGTTYQFDTEYSSEDISDVMNSNILEVSRYQTFENSNSIIFRATEASSEKEAQFLDYLSNKFNIQDSEIEFQRVGPTFGQEITQKGLRALIIFLSFIVILITYRYEFRYSLIALAALVHDLLLCFSIYLLLNLEITPSTVIALLTILGYSLYDTVILFDKLNDARKVKKQNNLNIETLNSTFNEVLMRSINTSITSVIPIASILFIGNYLGLSGALTELCTSAI
jgi:Preprotein translocase subunit SecF